MRSSDPDRLLKDTATPGPDDDTPTFELMRQWIDCMRTIERDRLASPLTSPVWCLRRWLGWVSTDGLHASNRRLWAAICRRHATLLYEHMAAAGIDPDDAPSKGRAIVTTALIQLQATGEVHAISRGLFASASAVLGPQPALKAKYFLRPFVDEITDPVGREAVRHYAFATGHRPPESIRQGRQAFHDGCAELRGILSRDASSLAEWTDGAVNARLLHRSIADPVPYLEHLLLPPP